MAAVDSLLRGLTLALLCGAGAAYAAQTHIDGPANSVLFGTSVTVLANGNIVITDPRYNAPAAQAGAVHLYSPTGSLIATVTGSAAGDRVGSGGVYALPGGNYVFLSPDWNNGSFGDAGAVTFCNGNSGCSGTVSVANSLTNTDFGTRVGREGVKVLANGNYVVLTRSWQDASDNTVGAVTFGNGATGIVGVVSAANSLVGSVIFDEVGSGGVVELANGDYVVRSPRWNGAGTRRGAVTRCSGNTGCVGAVSAANSLTGARDNDRVGDIEAGEGVVALDAGRYVVVSPYWDSATAADVGAVTWCAAAGCTGTVSAANSLTGSTLRDRVGRDGVVRLSDGHYAIASGFWDNGAVADVGAVNWCNGSTGCTGTVGTGNALVGAQAYDFIGTSGIAALSSGGGFVVGSPTFNRGTVVNAGAITRVASGGLVGVVSAANSRVGARSNDLIGASVLALANGNLVGFSADWDSASARDVGAVTWCATSCTGEVDASNALTGTLAGDRVGSGGVGVLDNGHYVVLSPFWSFATDPAVGAATWCNGASGCFGAVASANSLTGTLFHQRVGDGPFVAMPGGRYLVGSIHWRADAPGTSAGAATVSTGATGLVGTVSAGNSLVGSALNDRLGSGGAGAVGGNFLAIVHPLFGSSDQGAVTLVDASVGISGSVVAAHSVVGGVGLGGSGMNFSFDLVRGQLAVGQPSANRVTLLFLGP